MTAILRPLALLSAAFVLACAPDSPESAGAEGRQPGPASVSEAPLPEGAVARSLFGEPLFPPPLADDVRAGHEARLAEAEAAWRADPDDADAIIWYGRRLAYLGRYPEAIEVFTRGIELHPDDPRMLRHRGHRFVTVRKFDRAIDDFLAAVALIRGTEDVVEPDGLPNALGIPTSTLHFNIWYHLGLAHYLQGDFERALLAWNDCLAVSRHPDSIVATTYWLNNTLRRLGLESEADALLADVSSDADIIESGSYLEVLLLHKGELPPEDLAGATGTEATLASTTTGYGVAAWHLVNGRRETAFRMFEAIVDDDTQWPAFGYIAAEAELARLTDGGAGG